ncbi:MAG: AGE family epimerase/isomerase, partial [Parabacteroides sp.]
SNMLLEIEELVEPELVDKTIDYCVHEVLDVFYQPDLGVLLENMTMDNQLSDSYDGRLIDPGHGIEATWFMMDLGKRMNRPDIIEKALKITKQTFDYGWDKKYGGIFYFMDRKGYPVQQLEWDQKLWWVHLETLIATIKGYLLTGDEEALAYFKKVHDYTWQHFRDPEYGEWYGYLNRQGEVLLPLKGGKWKGCFHVPRGLYLCWNLLEACADK